jgi:outer membrane protein TolC
MVIRPAGEGLALRTRRTVAAATAAAALALGAAGCASSYWRTSADREVEDILAGKNDHVKSERERGLVLPRPSGGEPPGAGGAGEVRDPPIEVPASMSLGDALRIASLCNKEYLERRESLYLSALGLSGTRYLFSPRFTAALSYLVVDAKGLKPADAADASLTGEAILPTGATLTATARTDGDFDRNAGNVLIGVSQVTANLRQPLLAGAGYEASHEQLTRAEREVVYAVRDFSRFREQFLRDATERYYGILINRAVLRNTEERHVAVEYQTRRARALFDIGLQDKLEVLRAENDLLRVQNDLNDARDALGLARDQFKVFLGLPISVQFEVPEVDPVPVPVDVSLDSAVEAALANRFDLANRREQVEDAERALRIAKQDLLPDLSLEAEWTGTSAPSSDFLDQALRARTGSVGVFLELPLQRTLDRNAFRAAEIALERERRAYRQFRDEIVVEVRDSLRRLRQAATSLEIQGRIIEVEQKRYEKAQIDFNQGTIGNRDLLEAQQSLTDARNERVRRAVAYELARIDLDRSMGTIEIERDGSFRVLRAPAAAAKAGS